MCARCETAAEKVLADPVELERFLERLAPHVRCISGAIIHSGTSTANVNGLNSTQGAAAMYAACAVLAAQLAETMGPTSLELANRMRSELAKLQIVQPVGGQDGLGVMRIEIPKARA